MHYRGLLPTEREGNVFTGVCYSVHNRPHAYSVTAHPCWLLGHILWFGRYVSFWNAFLFILCTILKHRQVVFVLDVTHEKEEIVHA